MTFYFMRNCILIYYVSIHRKFNKKRLHILKPMLDVNKANITDKD